MDLNKRKKAIIGILTISVLLFCAGSVLATDFSTESDEVVVPISDLSNETNSNVNSNANANANANANVPPANSNTPSRPPVPPPFGTNTNDQQTTPEAGQPSALDLNQNINNNSNVNSPTGGMVVPDENSNIPPETPAGEAIEETVSRVSMALTGFAQTAQKEIIKVIENPEVKNAANVVVAPATTAVTVTAVSAVNFGFIFQYLAFLLTQPLAFFDRRRARRWGVVYNALSKMPVDLATVRLLDEKGRVIRTRVTDSKGRYLFIASAGTYSLEAMKSGYAFPSLSIGQRVSDAQYADLYNGGQFKLSDNAISNNIPIEPAVTEGTTRSLMAARTSLAAKHILAAVSTLVACLSLVISFSVWTIVACMIQLLMLLAVERYVWKKRPAKLGQVINKDNKPVRAVVRLFETTYNKLVDTTVTDVSGHFAFLVGANAYYAVAEAPGCQPAKTQTFDFSSVKGEQAIAPTIKLG